MVTVKLVPENREVETRGNRSAAAILKELGLAARGHLVVRDGQLITEDEIIREGEIITVISAISGGKR
jgi:sulfur carrier protein